MGKNTKKSSRKNNSPKKQSSPKQAKRTPNGKATNKGRTKGGKVPQGRTLTTHDKFLDRKAKQPEKERPVVVIEVNANDELAVVQLTTQEGKDRTRLPKYQQGKSRFKHYVETVDDEGKPIRVNDKFKENHPNMDVSREDVKKIKTKVLSKSKPAAENRKKMDKFRGKENKKNPRN